MQADNYDNLRDAAEIEKLHNWNMRTLDRKICQLRATLHDGRCHQITACRACDLLAWLLQPEQADRPQSFSDVRAHSFFVGKTGTWKMSQVHVDMLLGVKTEFSDVDLQSHNHPLGKSLLHVAAAEMRPGAVQMLLFEHDEADNVELAPPLFVTKKHLCSTHAKFHKECFGRKRQLGRFALAHWAQTR